MGRVTAATAASLDGFAADTDGHLAQAAFDEAADAMERALTGPGG